MDNEPKTLDGMETEELLKRAFEASDALENQPEPQKTDPEPTAPVEPQKTEPEAQKTEPEPTAPVEPQKTDPEPPKDPFADFKSDTPEDWPVAAKEMYQNLPPEAQSFLSQRHKEMQADYTRKSQELADMRKQNESLSSTVEQWKPYMQARQIDPGRALDTAIRMEQTLANGSGQEKRDLLIYLAQTYNITATDGAQPPQNAPQQGAPQAPPQVDPRAYIQQAVHQAVAPLEQHLTQQKLQTISQTLEHIRSEKDANGNLLRPYWNDVEQEMMNLANSKAASGIPRETIDPRELYETAIWINPTTRAALVAQRDRTSKSGIARQSSLANGSGAPAISSEPSTGTVEEMLRKGFIAGGIQ